MYYWDTKQGRLTKLFFVFEVVEWCRDRNIEERIDTCEGMLSTSAA